MGTVRVLLVGGPFISDFNKICGKMSDTWKVHVGASVNQVLLWFHTAGTWKGTTSLVQTFIPGFYEIYVLVFRRIYQTMM